MQHSPGVLGISRSDNPKVTHKAKKLKVLKHSLDKKEKDMWLKCLAVAH